ncbi:Alpha/Beta hydrolase protein [Amylocystis lapponica]|nr:Alpha/Beta hydrolase protein [Amylocystis lapponica]
MPLRSHPLLLDGASVDGRLLKMTANCYTSTDAQSHTDGLTLLFAHCVGGHKELWEPIIEHIFRVQGRKGRHHRIREAISFDYQSHGDAAILNKAVIDARDECISGYVWADAIAEYVRSPALRGRRIIAIGHSAGGGVLTLVASKFSPENVPFLALILIEPTMNSETMYAIIRPKVEVHRRLVMKGTLARRDAWADREEARAWLATKMPWKLWDPRALDLYVKHGLHTVPSSAPCAPALVTPKCTKRVEAMSYPDFQPHIEAAGHFAMLCTYLPIHLVWGTRGDFVAKEVRDSLSDASEGRIAASITSISGAGHLIVQEQPDAVAEAICVCLNNVEEPKSCKL